jgi:hypothetical protein
MDKAKILLSARKRLVRARSFIEDPARWTKHALARDASGRVVWPSTRVACAWCAMGALTLAGARARGRRDIQLPASNEAWSALARAAYSNRNPPDSRAIAWFNDASTTTHADVLEMFDRAVALIDEQLARLAQAS